MSLSALLKSSFRAALPAAVLLLLLAVPASAFAKDQVPDWVHAAAALKTPDLPRDTDAVFLLEETTYSIAPDGTRIDHVRKVVRVLRPQGRKYGNMYAGFNAGSKLRYIHIWSIGPDGKEYAVKDNELTESGSGEGFELYSDSRARGGRAPAMDVGAVAAVEYERQERPYENDITWIPGEDVPVVKETLALNLPAGFTFTSGWKGKPKAEAIDAEHGRTVWEVNNQAALVSNEKIPLSPSQIGRAPRMDIFYQGPGVGGTYGAMNGDWQGTASGMSGWQKTATSPTRRSPQRRRSWCRARQPFASVSRPSRTSCRATSAMWRSRSASADTSRMPQRTPFACAMATAKTRRRC